MRLLYLDRDQIEDLIRIFEKDTKAIKTELLKLCWYMRGGLSYTESLFLCFEEREIISKIVEENLETTQKTKMPFF